MRHFLEPLALAVALLTPGMGAAPLGGALIAPSGIEQLPAPGLLAAALTTVALAPVALRAHPHFDLAMRTTKRSCAPWFGSRHRRSPWSHPCAANPPTQTLDLIARRCNNLHALVADTVGRAS